MQVVAAGRSPIRARSGKLGEEMRKPAVGSLSRHRLLPAVQRCKTTQRRSHRPTLAIGRSEGNFCRGLSEVNGIAGAGGLSRLGKQKEFARADTRVPRLSTNSRFAGTHSARVIHRPGTKLHGLVNSRGTLADTWEREEIEAEDVHALEKDETARAQIYLTFCRRGTSHINSSRIPFTLLFVSRLERCESPGEATGYRNACSK